MNRKSPTEKSSVIIMLPVLLLLILIVSGPALAADPISWWKLNESSDTTAADSSGNGHTGTLTTAAGGLIWEPAAGCIAGALRFDGDGAANNTNPNPRVAIPTTDMSVDSGTICFWANLTDPAPNNAGSRSGFLYFFGLKGSGANDKIKLYVDSAARMRMNMGNYSFTLTTGYQFTRAQWYHMAITWEGSGGAGSYVVYINGSPLAPFNEDGTYSSFTALPATADIGNKGESTYNQSFHGLIDDVRIYNAALNATEIANMYSVKNPSPADKATEVVIHPILSWTAAEGAVSHNVYFGTDQTEVTNGTGGTLKGNQTAASFDPGQLTLGQSYYWRIEEVEGGGLVLKGYTCSFTVATGKPLNPVPSNNAKKININTLLSWTAGYAATTHSVYFGTTDPPGFKTTQTATTYDPSASGTSYGWGDLGIMADGWLINGCSAGNNWCSGSDINHSGGVDFMDFASLGQNWQPDAGTLIPGTIYYWRVDEQNPYAAVTGNLWAFTTLPMPGNAGSPTPGDAASDISISADLMWVPGSDAASHDIYFGTTSPGTFRGNQTSSSVFDTGIMEYNTTYYWRIDEKNSSGMTAGSVWSFTTAAPTPPGKATFPRPLDGSKTAGLNGVLSWAPGFCATSYDVYFGTSNPPGSLANTMNTTIDPGTLTENTKYYWRVDSKNTISSTTGDLWNFTTEVSPAGDPNLMMWLKLDEGSGNNIYDTSTHGNNGTLNPNNSSKWTPDGTPTWVTGKLGWALSFDGEDYAYVPDSPSIEFSNSDFSVCFWMKMPYPTGITVDTEERVLQNGTDGSVTDGGINATGKRYQFYYNGRYDLFRWCIDDDTDEIWGKSQVGVLANRFYTDEWVHVVGTRDTVGDMLYMYKDGRLAGTFIDQSGDIASPGEGLDIGNARSTASQELTRYGCHGLIDDIRIYNRVLSEQDVARMYNPNMAWDPFPQDKAENVDRGTILSWTAGDDAQSHDVYFGTNLADVMNGDETTYKGRAVSASYNPGGLAENTMYYWRVDEIGPSGTNTGFMWRLNTGSGGGAELVIECDGQEEASLRKALETIVITGGGRITFNCSYTTINISDRIAFYGNNMTLDGGTAITLKYTGPDLCTQTEGQDSFMELHGDNNTIRNFKLLMFPEGIHIQEGNNNTIENITWPTICEDALSNGGRGLEAFNTVIRCCSFSYASDKAVQFNNGGSATLEHCTWFHTVQSLKCIGGKPALYVIRNCLFNANGIRCDVESTGDGFSIMIENTILNPTATYSFWLENADNAGVPINALVQNSLIYNIPVKIDRPGVQDFGGGSVNLNGLVMSSVGYNYINALNTVNSGTKAENNEWGSLPGSSVDRDPVGAPGSAGTYAPVGPQCN